MAPVVRARRGRRRSSRASPASGSWKATGTPRRDPAPAPTGTGSRRSGTRGPCCGGSSAPGRPRRRTPAGGCAPRRRCRCVGLGDPPPQPARSARSCRAARSSPRRAAAGRRGAGRSAGARRRRAASTRPGRPSASVIVSASDGDALRAQHARPVVQAAVDLLPARSSAAARRARRVQPRNGVSAAACARGGEVGRSSASSSRSHSRAGAVREDAAGAVDDRRHADRVERVADQRGVAVRAHEHGDVAGRDRARAVADARRRTASSRDDVGGEVARRCARAPAGALRVAAAACGRRSLAVAATRTRSGAPRRAVRRGARSAAARDRAVDDPLVAELRAAEQRVVGVDQRPGRCAS